MFTCTYDCSLCNLFVSHPHLQPFTSHLSYLLWNNARNILSMSYIVIAILAANIRRVFLITARAEHHNGRHSITTSLSATNDSQILHLMMVQSQAKVGRDSPWLFTEIYVTQLYCSRWNYRNDRGYIGNVDLYVTYSMEAPIVWQSRRKQHK